MEIGQIVKTTEDSKKRIKLEDRKNKEKNDTIQSKSSLSLQKYNFRLNIYFNMPSSKSVILRLLYRPDISPSSYSSYSIVDQKTFCMFSRI